jgi:transposase-like protein
VRKDGHGRKAARVYRCRDCRRCFTARSATPFSGDRFPPDVIALAVRWYLRYRLSYADVAALRTERGVAVAPPYEEAARLFRRAIGARWSADETYVKVAGAWVYVYRAIDGAVRSSPST